MFRIYFYKTILYNIFAEKTINFFNKRKIFRFFKNIVKYEIMYSMNIPIHLTEKEKLLANKYAKKHSLSLNDAFKNSLFEKIKNEYGVNIKIGLPVSTENVPNEKTLNIIKNVEQNKSVEKSFDNAEELIKNLNS